MRRCAFLVLLALLAANCGGNAGSSFTAEENDSQTLALTTQTALVIENTNGTITITGSDATAELTCLTTKKVTSTVSTSDAQGHISDIDVAVSEDADSVTYAVTHPTSESRSYEVNFDITLPNHLNVVITLYNGNIALNATTTSVEVNLLNGTFVADLTLNDPCALAIDVGNGDIMLTLPNSTNAALTASVVNGAIINDGLIFTDQDISSTQFSGTLGTGDGSIVLSVANGQIEMGAE